MPKVVRKPREERRCSRNEGRPALGPNDPPKADAKPAPHPTVKPSHSGRVRLDVVALRDLRPKIRDRRLFGPVHRRDRLVEARPIGSRRVVGHVYGQRIPSAPSCPAVVAPATAAHDSAPPSGMRMSLCPSTPAHTATQSGGWGAHMRAMTSQAAWQGVVGPGGPGGVGAGEGAASEASGGMGAGPGQEPAARRASASAFTSSPPSARASST
jgi:hypothetical protein